MRFAPLGLGLTYPKVQYTPLGMRSLLDRVEWSYNPSWSLMEEGEGIWGDGSWRYGDREYLGGIGSLLLDEDLVVERSIMK